MDRDIIFGSYHFTDESKLNLWEWEFSKRLSSIRREPGPGWPRIVQEENE